MSLSFSDQAIKKNSSNRKKGIAISVICENLSPKYRIVSEQLSLKKLKSLKKMYELINVFATQQFCNFQWQLFPLLLLAKS